MTENTQQFEQRKADHIRLSLDPQTEATGLTGLHHIELAHEALPDLDFDEIHLQTTQLGKTVEKPLLISSMTAGHKQGLMINERLMAAAATQNWAMGVGSQRKELFDKNAHIEWLNIRKQYPSLRLFGNIGLAQIITHSLSDMQRLVDNLEADALQIHLNPLQEIIQGEGTPQFKGGLQAIETLCQKLETPIVIKETGCGISKATMQRLNNTGIKALDVSGFGGTHWGRIEGLRTHNPYQKRAAQTFQNWGINTLTSLQTAKSLDLDYEIWGSGGIRNGLDCAKLIALGATTFGFARPMLAAAIEGQEQLIELMSTIEFELKTALFCTGHANISALQENEYALL